MRPAFLIALALLGHGAADAAPPDPSTLAARIDEYVSIGWDAAKVRPATTVDDAAFARRVYLDLAGRIPTVAEIRDFTADASPDKRAKLVSRLVDSAAYARHSATFWRREWVPQIETPRFAELPNQLDAWLTTQLRDGVPYDQIVRDLLTASRRGHVLVTILDHGSGLFEFLDADHDGALSVRELRTAWGRLKAIGCVTATGFDRTKLPRLLLSAVSQGHPQTAIGKPIRGGPDWFRAMDRNGDGDVSGREFTGPSDMFGKLDTDKDGLLSSDEASKADIKR